MKIKVLHIVDSLQVGGLENGVVNLINHSDESRFEHSICCLRRKGPMADRIHKQGVEVVCMSKPSKDHMLPLRLAAVIRRINPTIVHTRNWGTIDGAFAAKLAGDKRLVHGEHGREFSDLTGQNAKRNFARRLLSFSADRIVAVSEEIRNWLINTVRLPAEKVITIRNGVDTERFQPPHDKKAAKRELGFDPEIFLIGSIGRLDPVKNYPMLLKALGILNADSRPFKAVVVGDGPERYHIKQLAEAGGIGCIDLVGHRDNVAPYYQAFDLFVQTSLAEGLSNTVLEAMASGVPVVATAVGGTPEIVRNEIAGFLVDSNDYIKLTEIIKIHLNDHEINERMGQAARDHCEANLSINTMVSSYEKLYSQLFYRS